jgi:hypothetical protein
MGVAGANNGAVPTSDLFLTSIPTYKPSFSTLCPFRAERTTLHLGFIFDFSTYQQA